MVFGEVSWVAGMFYGIKPAVAAIVLQAVWRIGSRTLKSPRKVPLLWAIALLSFVAIAVLHVPFPWVVLARRRSPARWAASTCPAQFAAGGGHGAAPRQCARTPRRLPDRRQHADAGARALQQDRGWPAVVAAGALLWLLPMAALVAAQGWDGTLAQMGWFFTKAALLTFGGAYAVLPYVYQGAVEHFQWLTGAADDRRPGARRDHARPADHGGGLRRLRRRLGAAGAGAGHAVRRRGAGGDASSTWFTFLPSFLFILAGGPLVEATHGNLQVHRAAHGASRPRWSA